MFLVIAVSYLPLIQEMTTAGFMALSNSPVQIDSDSPIDSDSIP